MKNAIRFFGIIVIAAMFGLPVYAQSNAAFDGAWKMGSYDLIISNNWYVYKEDGKNSTMGHITVANNQLTLNDTHEWHNGEWAEAGTTSVPFGYTLSGNTLVLRNGSMWPFLNGTWISTARTPFEGTWKMGTYELIVKNNGYIYKEKGVNSTMGIITFSSNQLTLHDIFVWHNGRWAEGDPTPGTFSYNLSGNTLVFANNSEWPFLNGTWRK